MSGAHPAEEVAVKLGLEYAAAELTTRAPPSNSQAVLQFLPDWMQGLQGEILRGASGLTPTLGIHD